MDVAEGAATVTSVLGEKLTEGRLPEGRLMKGRVAEGMLIVGKLADGKLIGSRLVDGTLMDGTLMDGTLMDGTLMDGRLGELNPRETIGTLIGATVGTVTATYSTLTDTTWGGFAGSPVDAVEVLPPLVLACKTDSIDEVRLDG